MVVPRFNYDNSLNWFEYQRDLVCLENPMVHSSNQFLNQLKNIGTLTA